MQVTARRKAGPVTILDVSGEIDFANSTNPEPRPASAALDAPKIKPTNTKQVGRWSAAQKSRRFLDNITLSDTMRRDSDPLLEG
jgi:hypothetical protein